MNNTVSHRGLRGETPITRSFTSSRQIRPQPSETEALGTNANAKAPKPTNRAANLVTFFAATMIGLGAYVYQYQKTGLPWNPFSGSPRSLNTEKWTPILLKNITKVSTHTSLFEFELPEPCEIPITSAIYVKDDQIQAMRAYTPIHTWPGAHSGGDESDTDGESSGSGDVTTQKVSKIQFLIKRYSEGQVSRFLHAARPGQRIEMRGPVVIWPASETDLENWEEIGMIAGGTGITAFLPIIHTALNSPINRTRLSLIFAAREPEELYFKEELDKLAKENPSRFKVTYTVDRAPENEDEETTWQGHVGFVERNMIEKMLPEPVPSAASEGDAQDSFNNKTVILVCGPENMINHITGPRGLSGRAPVNGLLGSMGYTLDQVVRFPN
ncbi:NADH-cytochrome b5 reductase [Actinomortierella wolfii]|nr:NADH-cytochrome b5 reductase [Actinomortierella wolfii]